MTGQPEDQREDTRVVFGDTSEWKDFGDRHPEFLARIGTIRTTIELAFKPIQVAEPIDKILFHLNRLCAEDFSEILLLSGNGYGIGAEKLLRGMYERAVTAIYLHEHPDKAEDFLDYHKITQNRMMVAVEATLGKNVFSPEQKQQIEDEFQSTKERFMVTDCQACGTKRLNHSWSKLDFVTMAKAGPLAQLLVPAYYWGVREGHSTVEAIFSRLSADDARDGEGLVFEGKAQRGRADTALLTAHKILVMVLDLQKDHFGLDALKGPVQSCIEDLFAIWDKSSQRMETSLSTAESSS
jgi:hypothetical protein